MNLKVKSILSVLAMTAAVLAAEPVVVAQPAVADSTAQIEATVEQTAPVVDSAPVEAVAPMETAEEVAPVAVRDGEVPAPVAVETAPAAENTVAAPAPTQTVTKVIYQPVYTNEPTAVRSDSYPVKTVYIAEKTTSSDSVSFDELRGYVPMKLAFGVEGFVGAYSLFSTRDGRIEDYEDYSGMTMRAGAFALFPMNEYTVGLRVGALFEQSDASASSSYHNSKAKIKQRKIDVPVTFVFKAPRSSFMFDVGVQADFPIKDDLKITFDSEKSKIDMIDSDYRTSIDWNLIFGFCIKANQYVALNFRFDVGVSNLYDADNSEKMRVFNVDGLSSTSFLLGMSFFLF